MLPPPADELTFVSKLMLHLGFVAAIFQYGVK